jgi:predicted RND superfamily exporter protein
MSNIFSEITEDIELKPTKSKKVIKWVVRIAVLLICGAFVLGQFKIKSLNKITNIEKSLQENTKAVVDLDKKTEEGFNVVNGRINKVYDDGLKAFTDFQEYNKKQLNLIIDYGQTNKSILKQILDINSLEKTKSIEGQIERAKTLPPVVVPKDSFNIIITPVIK